MLMLTWEVMYRKQQLSLTEWHNLSTLKFCFTIYKYIINNQWANGPVHNCYMTKNFKDCMVLYNLKALILGANCNSIKAINSLSEATLLTW
jgi:hypothetical protein